MNLNTFIDIHGFTILLGSVVLFFVILRLIEGISSISWPSTLGTIISSETQTDIDYPYTSYTEITYRYEVENREYFFTSRLARSLGTHSSAKSILEEYPIGNVMTVYYRPQDPETWRPTTGVSFWNYVFILAIPLLALLISRNLIVVLLIIGITVVLTTMYGILDKIAPTKSD